MKKNHQKNHQELPKLKSHLTEPERKKALLNGKSKRTESLKKNLKNTKKMKSPSLKPKSKSLSEWSPRHPQPRNQTTTKNNSTKPTKIRLKLSNNYQSRSKICEASWTSMTSQATRISKRLTLTRLKILTMAQEICSQMIQRFFQSSPVLLMQTPPCSIRHPKRIVERQKPTVTKRSRKSRTRSHSSSSINSRSKSTASSKQLKDITQLLSTLKKPSRIYCKPLNKKSKTGATNI